MRISKKKQDELYSAMSSSVSGLRRDLLRSGILDREQPDAKEKLDVLLESLRKTIWTRQLKVMGTVDPNPNNTWS